jgi:hypothetical protein
VVIEFKKVSLYANFNSVSFHVNLVSFKCKFMVKDESYLSFFNHYNVPTSYYRNLKRSLNPMTYAILHCMPSRITNIVRIRVQHNYENYA